ncbi:MAG: efflux transporter outer membrane subunit [Thermoanaerobaculia bacterium]
MFAVVALTLTSCASVGPQYTPPVTDVSPSFATELSPKAVSETQWWTRFEDPALTHLIEGALQNNHDVREAVHRVEAARAIRSETRQAILPTGDAGISRRFSDEGAVTTKGIDAGWELDLFGRVRSMNRAAEAEIGVSEALLTQARVVVAAEVARTYFLLRAAESRVTMFEQYRADQAEVVKVIEARVEEGIDDDADLARARTVLAEDTLAVANERHNVSILRNALAVLIGAMPGAWESPAFTETKLALDPIAVGDPGALLQRRPDVRAAERALAAQTAEIGVATAGLFPQVQLSGFAIGSTSWSAGPSLTWGIFDLGRVRAQIRRERAEAEGALAAYERTVLRALEDAQNAFSAFALAQESLDATDLRVRSARTATELVEVRYDEGVSSYFELLDARRSSVRAEIGRINSIAAHATATVDVFRALGVE